LINPELHSPTELERYTLGTLERQNFTRIVGRSDLKSETFDDLTNCRT
jgi:hypothetical protein